MSAVLSKCRAEEMLALVLWNRLLDLNYDGPMISISFDFMCV